MGQTHYLIEVSYFGLGRAFTGLCHRRTADGVCIFARFPSFSFSPFIHQTTANLQANELARVRAAHKLVHAVLLAEGDGTHGAEFTGSLLTYLTEVHWTLPLL